jgi:hypothetical protein
VSEFTCAECGETHEKGWSDEEAAAEHIALYGRRPDPDAGVLCDDCFEGFRAWLKGLGPEARLDLAEADQAAVSQNEAG